MKGHFSQSGEDLVIEDYFKGTIGTFADFGSNDGILFSNTYNLYLQGWNGILVEPSLEAFKRLEFNYRGNRNAKLFNCALTASYSGEISFYESGSHVTENDVSLLSTVNETELKRWAGSKNVFKKMTATACPVNDVLEESGFHIIDFFSIDIEGSEIEVLPQIDFGKYQTRLVCIEYNSNPNTLRFITGYCGQFGLTKQLLKNHENIILSI